jgi:hypothetical protein
MGNIPMDFTDDNIPSVYDEGIIVGNKIIKKKAKKNNHVTILPTELQTKFIPSVKSVDKTVGKL